MVDLVLVEAGRSRAPPGRGCSPAAAVVGSAVVIADHDHHGGEFLTESRRRRPLTGWGDDGQTSAIVDVLATPAGLNEAAAARLTLPIAG
jgi:hypothetical protein